jgi:lauroyl/myristoyl acyltransferase
MVTSTSRPWIHATLRVGDLHRRLMGIYFAVIGPRAAYALMAALGRALYRLLTPFRLRSEAQCGAALGAEFSPPEVARVSERAFVHRIWNLADLLLAPRLLHPNTYESFGGRIPEPHLTEILAAQRRGQPAILVSAYFGSYDLLPVFLGYNGVRAAAVYLPHGNPAYDELRRRVRARSGCELMPVEEALQRLPQVLEAGGTVAIVADHHDERRGLPATLLGLPTRVSRSVGLLAWRYDADVVVAGIRRIGERFAFRIEVMDVIKHDAWRPAADVNRAGAPATDRSHAADADSVIQYVTDRYLRATEALVHLDPAQYLWGYARWGEELARRLTEELSANGPNDRWHASTGIAGHSPAESSPRPAQG